MKMRLFLVCFSAAILFAAADNLPLVWDFSPDPANTNAPNPAITNYTIWKRSLGIINWTQIGSSGTNLTFTVTNTVYGDQFYVLAHQLDQTNASPPSNVYPAVIPVRNVRAILLPGIP